MTEPWEKIDYSGRVNETDTVFYLFCEDGSVEPSYFKKFESESVKINFQPEFGQHHENVNLSVDFCHTHGLIEKYDGNKERIIAGEGFQTWCVFDRDKTENGTDGKDLAFNGSIQHAEAIGMRVAWSNDCFELWILLHFEEVPGTDSEYSHRKKYYERLTEWMKAIPDKTDYEREIFGKPNFDYKRFMKNRDRFLPIVAKRMEGMLPTAISRAQLLEGRFDEALRPHEMMPCTKVHHLVQAILNAGGKKW
jgi:RloB-like protein